MNPLPEFCDWTYIQRWDKRNGIDTSTSDSRCPCDTPRSRDDLPEERKQSSACNYLGKALCWTRVETSVSKCTQDRNSTFSHAFDQLVRIWRGGNATLQTMRYNNWNLPSGVSTIRVARRPRNGNIRVANRRILWMHGHGGVEVSGVDTWRSFSKDTESQPVSPHNGVSAVCG